MDVTDSIEIHAVCHEFNQHILRNKSNHIKTEEE